jgi:glycosyltransferase involved in cell wall biosynthesis
MDKTADICLICEGSYPYHSGGVSDWVHEMILEHKEKTFHILSLVPPNPELVMRYSFPQNVIGMTTIIVEDLPEGSSPSTFSKQNFEIIEKTFKGLISSKKFKDFDPMIDLFKDYRKVVGKQILFESRPSWDLILKLYDQIIPNGPFKSYFSTIYTLSRALYSILIPELPKAKLFHSVCTGYAGFLLHRAKKELGATCLLTEHGIYSNERRIDIAMSKWIVEIGSLDLDIQDKQRTLKDMWLNAFFSMAYVCYSSADYVISTFDGNQTIQIEAGADPKKVSTIVHGIKKEKYQKIKQKRQDHPPTVAFIGRVVPIKDVKTFIRACEIVHKELKDVRFFILGSLQEDPEYVKECQALSASLNMEKVIPFLGSCDLSEYYTQIDVVVLTSISEAQPLVILEAGAVGIPCVATHVGACDQLIYGDKSESLPLGNGGVITPLMSPESTASAILKLLKDPDFYKSCSQCIEERIQTYYQYDQEHAKYRSLYAQYT